jgi:hypothetical protein
LHADSTAPLPLAGKHDHAVIATRKINKLVKILLDVRTPKLRSRIHGITPNCQFSAAIAPSSP